MTTLKRFGQKVAAMLTKKLRAMDRRKVMGKKLYLGGGEEQEGLQMSLSI